MKLVGETGFEPATLCSQNRCATRLRHSPTASALDEVALGCKEICRKKLVGPAGLEPAT